MVYIPCTYVHMCAESFGMLLAHVMALSLKSGDKLDVTVLSFTHVARSGVIRVLDVVFQAVAGTGGFSFEGFLERIYCKLCQTQVSCRCSTLKAHK